MKQLLWLVTCAAIGLGVAGCGSSATENCVDLCNEAQAGDCTSIMGNCNSFCTAVDGVQDEAGCVDEREAYQDCLNQGANVCDNNCDALETAFGNCLAAYCLQNATNADCQTLSNSLAP